LWSLDSDNIAIFCTAWRKALHRIFNLPYNSHSYLLPIISNTLPIFVELCKRSARFITSCLFSPSCLYRSVSWYSVVFGKYDSPLGANALYCCNRFEWAHDLFLLNLVDLTNSFFYKWYNNNLTDTDLDTARSLLDIIFIREGDIVLPDNFTFTKSQITDIIAGICT
jgi:hypothetical protein